MIAEQVAKPVNRQKKWQDKNPQKRWAHIATQSALNRGLIEKQPCEVCGEARVDAHHDNYDTPMKVRWLCRQHHKDWHREMKKGAA